MLPYRQERKTFTGHCEYLLSRRTSERLWSDEEVEVLLFYINEIEKELLDEPRNAAARRFVTGCLSNLVGGTNPLVQSKAVSCGGFRLAL